MPRFPIEDISLLAWCILGALALTSVYAAAITVAKLLQFRRAGVGRGTAAAAAVTQWTAGDRPGALAAIRQQTGARAAMLTSVFTALLEKPSDAARAQAIGMQSAIEDLARLDRHMRGMEAVVQAAPMLGLLGTVVGMIEAFGRLAQTTGAADPAELAGGIWTALVTTALGLAVAILFYFISLLLEARITRERETLDSILARVVNAENSTPAAAAGGGSMTSPPDRTMVGMAIPVPKRPPE